MNPKLQFVFQRRSIRRYRPGDVPAAVVQDLVEAAMAAPSACAKDPWHFVIVRDKATLAGLADGLPNGQMLREATAGIAVLGDPARAHDGQLSYLLQDCSAAVENLLLAAAGLGLGACWLGVHPREDRLKHVRRLLGVPETILPVAVVALGWPGEDKPGRTRYDAGRVHMDRW